MRFPMAGTPFGPRGGTFCNIRTKKKSHFWVAPNPPERTRKARQPDVGMKSIPGWLGQRKYAVRVP